MRRRLTASTLFALVLAVTAGGQPPPKNDPSKKADKPADPTATAIASALATDPDVKMAQAKIQLAEAELAKARQAVTLKVLTLKAKLEQSKAELRAADERYFRTEQLVKAASVPQSELLAARDKIEAAKGALAAAEAEWKFLTGPSGPDAARPPSDFGLQWVPVGPDGEAHRTFVEWYAKTLKLSRDASAIKGPVPDRLRAVLDKSVKIAPKGEKVTFSKALEVFKKDAGLDVPFRSLPLPDPEIVSEGEELPVGAWLQLFQDTARLTFYVREYGLLAANKQTAPPDAPTLTEFWKQKPVAAPAEPKPAPEPKPK